MAENKLDQQKNAAAGWCLTAAVIIPIAFGLWRDWPGPWWAYLVASIIIFIGVLGGWVQATQEDDVHRAVTEMNERDKATNKAQE
ncbi:hypothetical protein [Halomonas sp. M4R1S46]|uniref:hypothetical protein n=1 Tax=Halomonas sp. M4R1S46 TaxID=2982692 RepID=UPI0021E39E98|nr:hypothetical protein [Halomonas sp. M4R1S46]UYG08393.1 hypothetical protein OCT48_03360 [Halomonas sp. M4R1S46]